MNKYFFKIIVSLFVLSFSIFVSVSFVVRPVKVNDNAMYPAYKKDSYILVNVFNKTTSKISKGDVVVVKTNDGYKVRRIIALPRTKIKMVNDELYLSDNRAFEEYLNQEYMASKSHPFTKDFYAETGENEYFVMGDNRDDSFDSRNGMGVINKKDIISAGVFIGGDK